MPITRLMLRLAAAIPIAAAPLVAQDAPPPAPSALLETMRTNVNRIMPSLEEVRWSANINLWTLRLDHPRKLDASTLAKMRRSLDSIANIVSQLRAPDEKGRWQANVDLWRSVLDDSGMPTAATLRSMAALLTGMEHNVAQIAAPGEKERWSANRDLWRAALGTKRKRNDCECAARTTSLRT